MEDARWSSLGMAGQKPTSTGMDDQTRKMWEEYVDGKYTDAPPLHILLNKTRKPGYAGPKDSRR